MIIIPDHQHHPNLEYLDFVEMHEVVIVRNQNGLIFVDYVDGEPYLFVNKWGAQYRIPLNQIFDEVDDSPEFIA